MAPARTGTRTNRHPQGRRGSFAVSECDGYPSKPLGRGSTHPVAGKETLFEGGSFCRAQEPTPERALWGRFILMS